MIQSVQRPKIKVTRSLFHDPVLDAEFKERGYVVYPGYLTADDITRLRALYEEQKSDLASGFHASIYTNDLRYRNAICKQVQDLYNQRLADILVDYRACLGNFMVKEPGDPQSEMPLHQDWSFVAEPELVSIHVWSPLQEVNSENGCLAVVPGSHHLSDPVRAFADDCPFRETFPMIRSRYLREIPIKAGHAVMYDGRLIHGSRSNTSANRRLAVQCITVPREAKVQHAYRVSPSQVELFDVQDEFFLRYELHKPPQDVPSAGLVDYEVRQLTPEQVEILDLYL